MDLLKIGHWLESQTYSDHESDPPEWPVLRILWEDIAPEMEHSLKGRPADSPSLECPFRIKSKDN